jgi:drug/metabolite transporter (DMT)-like permease
MSLLVFATVLAAAAIHAGWNAVVKLGHDALLSTVLVAGAAALIALAALPLLPPVAPAAWPFLLLSGALEVGYYALVAAAYGAADMSRAYPLMRGTPPLIVALVSAAALGTALSPAGWAGIGLISAGLAGLALAGRGGSARGTLFALANGLVIASYTLVDGMGVRLSGAPVTYTMWVFLLSGAPLVAWALLQRRAAFGAYLGGNWPLGLAGGAGTLVSYGLVLWAMTEAPVPLVAALRETSILFGAAIAALLLREKVGLPRLAAILVVAAGAMVLRLA